MVAVKDVFEGNEACCNGLQEILWDVGVQAVVDLHVVRRGQAGAGGVEDSRVNGC